MLDCVLSLPPIVSPLLSRQECKTRCLVEYATLRSGQSYLSSLILNPDPRLLYYVIVRTFLPKPNSTDHINVKTLEAIYLLMSGRPVNFSCCMLKYMSKVSSTQHLAPLPYANLLTLIFHHFGVCLTHEVRENRLVPTITP